MSLEGTRPGYFGLILLLSAALAAGCGNAGGVGTRSEPKPEVAKKRSDGAELLFVAPDGGSAQNPAYSPDNGSLVFTIFHKGYNRGPSGVFLLSSKGGLPIFMIDEPGHDSVNLPGSCWNPKTNRIVFSSDREEADEIWTSDPDGNNLKRVTRHTDGASYIEPSFSPDGDWIVFEARGETGGGKETGGIWKVRSDGDAPLRLTGGDGADDRQPNWSPAGDRILFQRRDGGAEWDVYTMSSDGGDVGRVNSSGSSDTDASWSPDGKWIAYSTDYGDLEYPKIFAIPASGGKPIRVTRVRDREDSAPSWSPDGQWIAFESHLTADGDSPTALYRIKAPEIDISHSELPPRGGKGI